MLKQVPVPFGEIYYGRGKTLSPKSVSLRGEVHGLFSSWNLRQVFCNDTGASIKAGYLCALPWKTVFLEMNMQIGSRGFKGKIIEKKDYRGYMDESLVDSIVRFDEPAYGTLGANLGELGVNESIIVDIRCAFFLEYERGQISLHIPAWNVRSSGSFDMYLIRFCHALPFSIHF